MSKSRSEHMLSFLAERMQKLTTVEQCAEVLDLVEELKGIDYFTTDQANQLKHAAYQKIIDIMECQDVK